MYYSCAQVCLDADANAVKNQFLAPLDLGKAKAKPQFDVDQIDFNRKVLHRCVGERSTAIRLLLG